MFSRAAKSAATRTGLGLLFLAAGTVPVTPGTGIRPAAAGTIRPDDLVYRGAFRLPGPEDETGWAWGGNALTYYSEGDPGGGADGYPGSLFGTGHDWHQYVSEIGIPVPVISPGKNPEDLNTATTLQPFADIRSLLFGEFEIPYAGLEYLPAGSGRGRGRLYLSWHQHLQISPHYPTHGRCELDLSAPAPGGPWYIGDYDTYSTTDYLFSVPQSWADAHAGGRCLATGRMRDGGQGGQGPCIFVCAPWQEGDPAAPGATIPATPLLLYSTSYWDDPDGGAYTMDRYHHSDMWPGAAWLTAGEDAAVVFAGTKGRGDCWYGNENGPCLDCENRGWWSTYFDGEIIFFDPDDLAAVAAGEMETHEPQPYAVLNIDDVLFHVDSPQMHDHVKAAACDREHGFLYVFEPLADGDKPIVHVWAVRPGEAEPSPAPSATPAAPAPATPTPIPLPEPGSAVLQSGDYDGDGTADIAVFRPATALWAVRNLGQGYYGRPGDFPVSGDYDGDGTVEAAVFRPATGRWAARGVTVFYFGGGGDIPVPGDYDGDGTAEAAVFRQTGATWIVRGLSRVVFGRPGDRPVPGPYRGGPLRDIAVFRPGSALWAFRGFSRVFFGKPDDVPIPGDYDGDGAWEAAIFRNGTGLWAVRGETRFHFGGSGDVPLPADYDGDARDDVAVFRDTVGLWALRGNTRIRFGREGDIPVTR